MLTRLLVLVLGMLALAAGAASAPQKRPPPLYGLLERAGRDDLVRLDGRSFRPSWTRNRVLALVSNPGSWDVVAIDPAAGRVVGRTTLDEQVLHAVPTVRGLTLVTAPASGHGSARVIRIAGDLRPRSVTLDRVTVGLETSEDPSGAPVFGPWRSPGFALRGGALGATAWVLAGGAPPAAVDLESFTARYGEGRMLAAAAKSREASIRFAQWVTGDVVVYGGIEHAADGTARRVGASLLDARTWSARLLDPRATQAVAGRGSIVTWDSWPAADRALGLRVFGTDGSRRFSALSGTAIGAAQIAGDRVLVGLSGPRPVAKVVSLSTGESVTTLHGNIPALLVGRGAGW